MSDPRREVVAQTLARRYGIPEGADLNHIERRYVYEDADAVLAALDATPTEPEGS